MGTSTSLSFAQACHPRFLLLCLRWLKCCAKSMNYFYILNQYALRMVFSTYFNTRVFGRQNVPVKGPVLLVSNHQSFLDPMLCGFGLNRELDYMARDTLFHNKFFGALIRAVNTFPVQRGQADVKAIREIISRLKTGRGVTIFPEGTRSSDGSIAEFKSGFDIIARRSGATTVPVVIDGAFDLWSRHQILPKMGKIYVMYGKAVTPEQIKAMPKDKFVRHVSSQIRQMQTDLRKKLNKPVYDYT